MKKSSGLSTKSLSLSLAVVLITALLAGCSNSSADENNDDTNSNSSSPETVTLTNVSYDPTRELYERYNKIFQQYWEDETGQKVEITQSHGGSGSQARSVLEGNEADVVTLALEGDVDELRKEGLIEEGWVDKLPKSSSPYTSTIVFLVREGNPKNIQDWDDIVKDGVEVITPDPKSSGGARWNFLAAWAYADKLYDGDETKNEEFLESLYSNVSVLDSGARGATTTFVENGQGDVLLAWENEAFLSLEEYPGQFEIVTPSLSILAQPSVAVVDEIAEKRSTAEVAKAYLEYLYSEDAQRLEGENYYRPSDPDILEEFADVFDLDIELVTIEDFGGWEAATEKFFVDGAVFDQIYKQ